jgi:hypothetical protein
MSTDPENKDAKLAKPIGEKSVEPAKPAELRAPVLGVTTYDRVVSILLTFMMIFGLGTATFGAIWFSNQQWITNRPPPKIDVIDFIDDVEGGGAEDGVLGESLYAPGPEALEVSSAVTADDVVSDTPAVEQQMTAILDAVGAAMEVSETLLMGTDVGSTALPGGNPKGKGRFRNLGKGPGDGGGVKRQERWEITFDAGQTEQEYATQLDYFRVELGAIVDRKMYMVQYMARPKPDVKITAGGPDEKRLYFSWRSGGRRQIDLNLLSKAGVPLAGNVIVLQFYPTETEQLLARLERDYLQLAKKHTDMRVVRKTKFSVVKKGGGYEFQITKQEYFGEKA